MPLKTNLVNAKRKMYLVDEEEDQKRLSANERNKKEKDFFEQKKKREAERKAAMERVKKKQEEAEAQRKRDAKKAANNNNNKTNAGKVSNSQINKTADQRDDEEKDHYERRKQPPIVNPSIRVQERMSKINDNKEELQEDFDGRRYGEIEYQDVLANWELGSKLYTDSLAWAGGYINPELEVEYAQREEIMDKAYEYANFEWAPTEDIYGWNGKIEYRAGQTYYGVPYSKHGHSSPNEFFEKIDSYGFDKKYTNRDGDTMPWYGQDCSGLVSDAWGLDRMTTKFMMYAIEDGSMPKLENYSNLKPGDAIVKNGHTRLVAYVEGDKVYTIEQTTGDKAYGTHLDSYSFSDLSKEKYVPITRIGLDETALEESRDRYNNG